MGVPHKLGRMGPQGSYMGVPEKLCSQVWLPMGQIFHEEGVVPRNDQGAQRHPTGGLKDAQDTQKDWRIHEEKGGWTTKPSPPLRDESISVFMFLLPPRVNGQPIN